MKRIMLAGIAMSGGLFLTACGGGGSGSTCSKVSMRIVVEQGMFANNVSAVLSNNSKQPRLVTISAVDPDGNGSTIGPISVSAKGSVKQMLGPLTPSYGTTQAELERNGAKFRIVSCK